MARGVRDDLRRISDSCMKRIGSCSTSRKRPKYWWTDELGELWKESCLARRRFVDRERLLIKRGGRYEDIVNDDELARLKVEGFAGSGPTSDMEFQGGVLEGTPERSGFGSVGSPVPSRDEQTEGFVGTAVGRHDGGVFRRSDRRALPRRGLEKALGSGPALPHPRRVRRSAVCASLGALHRVLPRGDISDSVERSQLSFARQTG